jgi:hypothetical protein
LVDAKGEKLAGNGRKWQEMAGKDRKPAQQVGRYKHKATINVESANQKYKDRKRPADRRKSRQDR